MAKSKFKVPKHKIKSLFKSKAPIEFEINVSQEDLFKPYSYKLESDEIIELSQVPSPRDYKKILSQLKQIYKK